MTKRLCIKQSFANDAFCDSQTKAWPTIATNNLSRNNCESAWINVGRVFCDTLVSIPSHARDSIAILYTRPCERKRRVCKVSRGTLRPLKIETRLRSIIEGESRRLVRANRTAWTTVCTHTRTNTTHALEPFRVDAINGVVHAWGSLWFGRWENVSELTPLHRENCCFVRYKSTREKFSRSFAWLIDEIRLQKYIQGV